MDHNTVSISWEDGQTWGVAYINGQKDGSYNLHSAPSIGSSVEIELKHHLMDQFRIYEYLIMDYVKQKFHEFYIQISRIIRCY